MTGKELEERRVVVRIEAENKRLRADNERGYKMIRHIRTTIADASTMDSETARNRQLQEAREENAKLRAALKESMEHIGTAHCSGYKCRLPHCDSCNEDPIDIWDVMPRWIKLLKEGD